MVQGHGLRRQETGQKLVPFPRTQDARYTAGGFRATRRSPLAKIPLLPRVKSGRDGCQGRSRLSLLKYWKLYHGRVRYVICLGDTSRSGRLGTLSDVLDAAKPAVDPART